MALGSMAKFGALKGYLNRGNVTRRGITGLGSIGSGRRQLMQGVRSPARGLTPGSPVNTPGNAMAAIGAAQRSYNLGKRRLMYGAGAAAAYYDVAAGPQRANGRSSGATGMPPPRSTGGFA